LLIRREGVTMRPLLVGLERIAEKELVAKAQQGDERAFEELHALYGARIYCLCYRMVKNRHDAEDLTQEVFLLLHRRVKTFRGKSAFGTWFYRLAANVALMCLREKRRRERILPTSSLDEFMAGDDGDEFSHKIGAPDPRLKFVGERLDLREAVAQLPPGYRAAFYLRYVEGYKYREVAKILGVTVGTVKSQSHRARLRLREKLSQSKKRREQKGERFVMGRAGQRYVDHLYAPFVFWEICHSSG